MTSKDSSRLVDFKATYSLAVGLFTSLYAIEDNIRTFCQQYSLSYKMLTSGLLTKNITVLISGVCKENDVAAYKQTFENYFRRLS